MFTPLFILVSARSSPLDYRIFSRGIRRGLATAVKFEEIRMARSKAAVEISRPDCYGGVHITDTALPAIQAYIQVLPIAHLRNSIMP